MKNKKRCTRKNMKHYRLRSTSKFIYRSIKCCWIWNSWEMCMTSWKAKNSKIVLASNQRHAAIAKSTKLQHRKLIVERRGKKRPMRRWLETINVIRKNFNEWTTKAIDRNCWKTVANVLWNVKQAGNRQCRWW